MQTLPSGLAEHVADDESLARFLTQSNQFGLGMAKPAALLPNPKHRNTSVFRMGAEPDQLRRVWAETNTSDRQAKAAALFKAADVRKARLEVAAQEPPPAHANIDGWPWLDSDPELQKAQQKERAQEIASKTTIVLL
jgi:hypothetical protein